MAPKKIIVFSDGTGNSAASQFKTNVWRLYQALDLSAQDTLVKYDDGVGTETFKPLRMIGGAFGYGLARNVKELYAFLCRNYLNEDEIYAFGFSRGSFTIRILIGLVSKCGLFTAVNESELQRKVDLAYIKYRRDFICRVADAKSWHGLFPYFPFVKRPYFVKRPRYKQPPPEGPDPRQLNLFEDQFWPPIKFLGLWDTIDAYGMPVDELKHGLDRWVWPMTVADRSLSKLVKRARHALSLDDERPTFRPVLWTEKDELPPPPTLSAAAQEALRPPRTPGWLERLEGSGELAFKNGSAQLPASSSSEPPRIKQVWFAGVHANVGGGYPDDSLALVSLDWMMDEAEQAGLTFISGEKKAIRDHKNQHGRNYDSRAGVADYYRYGPRSVMELCHDDINGVSIDMPQIHRSVFERIACRRVAYSPVSLPETYVVEDDPSALEAAAKLKWPFASHFKPEQGAAPQRVEDRERALDAVWQRRVAYFATVITTGLLVLFPVIACLGLWPQKQTAVFDALDRTVGTIVRFVFARAQDFAPGWSKAWLTSFSSYPAIFLVLSASLAWLFFITNARLHRIIDARAEWAWRQVKQSRIPVPPSTWTDYIACKLRNCKFAGATYRFFARHVFPFFFAWTIALALIPIIMIKLKWEDWRYRTERVR